MLTPPTNILSVAVGLVAMLAIAPPPAGAEAISDDDFAAIVDAYDPKGSARVTAERQAVLVREWVDRLEAAGIPLTPEVPRGLWKTVQALESGDSPKSMAAFSWLGRFAFEELEARAATGDSWSAYFLGRLHENASDPEWSRLYHSFDRSGLPPEARPAYHAYRLKLLGRPVRSKEAPKAGDYYKAAAEAGNARAMAYLGRHLAAGTYGKKDPEAGLAWQRKSTEAGDPLGKTYYGLALLPDDPERASAMIFEAAATGHPTAQSILADLLASGQIKTASRDADLKQAARLKASAAEGGQTHATVSYWADQIIAADRTGQVPATDDGPKTPADLLRLKVAEARSVGHFADLMSELGERYRLARNAPQSDAKAFAAYSEGTAQARAQYQLFFLYWNGKGTEKDEWEAWRQLEIAAMKGYEPALARVSYSAFAGLDRGKKILDKLVDAGRVEDPQVLRTKGLDLYADIHGKKALKDRLIRELGEIGEQQYELETRNLALRSAKGGEPWPTPPPTFADSAAFDRYHRSAREVSVAEVLKEIDRVRIAIHRSTELDPLLGDLWDTAVRAVRPTPLEVDPKSPIYLHIGMYKLDTAIAVGVRKYPVTTVLVTLQPQVTTRIYRDGAFHQARVGLASRFELRTHAGPMTKQTYLEMFNEMVASGVDGLLATKPPSEEGRAERDRAFRASLWPADQAAAMFDRWRAANTDRNDLGRAALKGIKSVRLLRPWLPEEAGAITRDGLVNTWEARLGGHGLRVDRESPHSIYHSGSWYYNKGQTRNGNDAFYALFDAVWVMQDNVVFDLNGKPARVQAVLLHHWDHMQQLPRDGVTRLPAQVRGTAAEVAAMLAGEAE